MNTETCKKLFAVIMMAMVLAVMACAGKVEPNVPGPCDKVTCKEEHTVCKVIGTKGVCVCETGYAEDKDAVCRVVCSEDKNCPEKHACQEKLCQPVDCLKDEDCAKNQLCQANKCVDACEKDADCGQDLVCKDKKCMAADACVKDEHCGKNQKCKQNKCIDVPECESDRGCKDSEKCVDGKCVPLVPPCEKDSDCKSNESCKSGKCVVKSSPVCVDGVPVCSCDPGWMLLCYKENPDKKQAELVRNKHGGDAHLTWPKGAQICIPFNGIRKQMCPLAAMEGKEGWPKWTCECTGAVKTRLDSKCGEHGCNCENSGELNNYGFVEACN